jgi:glycosyltransferase involved in cell wall biosynthesis
MTSRWKALFKTRDKQQDKPELQIQGKLDLVVAGCATGWAFDPGDPLARLRIDLDIDGKYHDTVAATLYREDLAAAGIGDGFHAFRYPLPPWSLDGNAHRIQARISGTRANLETSKGEVFVRGAAKPFDVLASPKLWIDPARAAGRSLPRITRKDRKKNIPAYRGAERALNGISVIIPTYNRGQLIEETLRISMACAEDAPVEFIVIDDGSTDDTPQRLARLASELPNVRFKSVTNGGQGRARNVGVGMAQYELVLFQGDDIRPACSRFYYHHLFAHRGLPQPGVAVLGKITWPDTKDFPINFTMSQIQGRGQQQFSYYGLTPYGGLDWRFFYTSNVSMKKSAIADWEKDGFSPAFRGYGWEDAELAYRLSLTIPDGFVCLYCPAPVATHHHIYTAKEFIEREVSTGRAARTFVRLHPGVRKLIGVADLDACLNSPWSPGGVSLPDVLSVIEGLKAWPVILEQRYELGSQSWHGDLLSAVFYLSVLEGYIMTNENPHANYDAAYTYAVREFHHRLGASASYEAFGRNVAFLVG